MEDYKVWFCKIVIPGASKTPRGFDSPPRMAAVEAIEKHGFSVLACFSGWGGSLSESEKSYINKK